MLFFYSSSTVSYGFRGITGTFTGNAPVSDQVTAMKSGLSNQVQGAYRSWSTSSRSSSTDAAGSEMMNAQDCPFSRNHPCAQNTSQ